MAKFEQFTNARLKNTFIEVYIVDIFEDATETRYAVLKENGETVEKKESELRPTFRAIRKWLMWEFDIWVRSNPTTSFFIFGGICYVLGFLTCHIISKIG